MQISMNLPHSSYPIYVKRGILPDATQFLRLDRRCLIVTDDGVPAEYSATVEKQCTTAFKVILKQGEKTKSLENFELLCKTMLENNFSRKDCVIAVGGGVIGDLAGFAAASYMRGIDFYNIPTTLLSQVDSSIGGKVAINFHNVKNIVGAFYQPKAVLIDTNVLQTLDNRQFSNGLAEAIKMSLTSDKELFELIASGNIRENIEEIIYKSLLIKKSIVEADEKENSLRKILNFGHTVGHAYETLNLGLLYHGECVALGMLPMCSKQVRSKLISVLKANNLPTQINCATSEILSVLQHDKKADGNFVEAVFVDKIGSCKIMKTKISEIAKLL